MGESMYIPMFCNNYHELPGIGVPGTGESMYISKPSDDLLSSLLLLLLLLLVGRWPVYSSASLHLFIGRPLFLFPSDIPSCTFPTSRSPAILDMCPLHSVLLLCTLDVMFWISHDSRILSFLALSHFVIFVILLNVFISVTSNICMIFVVSVRVSAA